MSDKKSKIFFAILLFYLSLLFDVRIALGKKVRYVVNAKETKVEVEKKKETSTEDKFYYIRAITGIIAPILGRAAFGLVGWWMLLYMVLIWVGWPWIMSFVILRIPYQKGKWDWKMILKTGWGIYFLLFMFIGTIVHTIMFMAANPEYYDIFANPIETT